MNRRHLLYGAGLAGAASFGYGGWLLIGPAPCMGLSYSDLPENIRALHHEDFAAAFPQATLEEIVMELRDLGVCTRSGPFTRSGLCIERVRRNAADDPLVEFDGQFWTKSELLVYTAVARLRLVSHPHEKKER